MHTDLKELNKAANLILQYCKIHHIGLKSNSSITSGPQASRSSLLKDKLRKNEENVILVKFLKTCGIKGPPQKPTLSFLIEFQRKS